MTVPQHGASDGTTAGRICPSRERVVLATVLPPALQSIEHREPLRFILLMEMVGYYASVL